MSLNVTDCLLLREGDKEDLVKRFKTWKVFPKSLIPLDTVWILFGEN